MFTFLAGQETFPKHENAANATAGREERVLSGRANRLHADIANWLCGDAAAVSEAGQKTQPRYDDLD